MRILIFGGTRGLGKAVADRFRQKGDEVLATGQADVDLANADALELYLKRGEGRFDVIVYCAGQSVGGFVEDTPIKYYEKCFQVNFFSPLRVYQFFQERDALPASFVFVLSGVCEIFLPGLSAYSLSKRALRDLIPFLEKESRNACKIIGFYPGGMKTEFDLRTPLFGKYRLFPNPRANDPEVAAQKLVRLIEKRRKGSFGRSPLLRLWGFFQNIRNSP